MEKYKDPLLPDSHFHVFNHAVGEEQIFINEQNYYYFLRLFQKHVLPVADVFAYCLMSNHFHFFLQIKSIDFIELQMRQVCKKKEFGIERATKFVLQQFSNFFNAYTKAINKQQHRMGKLFMEPFKRRWIDHPENFRGIVHYVHVNPLHHGFCKKVVEWQFSSYPEIARTTGSTWLKVEEVIKWFGSIEAFIEFHDQPVERKFF